MEEGKAVPQASRPLPSKKRMIVILSGLFIALLVGGTCGWMVLGPLLAKDNQDIFPFAPGGSTSTPLGVYEAAEIGMSWDRFTDKIDPDYANGSCWLVECSSLSGGAGSINLTATNTFGSPYYAYIFMPVFSEAQATIIGFNSADVVIAYGRVNYDSAYDLILFYGSRTFW